MCEDNSIGIFGIDGHDSMINMFLNQVKYLLSDIITETIEDQSEENTPLYFDLIDS